MVYVCDLYNFTANHREEPFDCVFDRAAFVAIPIEQRTKYAEKVVSLCKPIFKYLLVTEEYDDRKYDIGPPWCAREADISKAFRGLQ